MKISLSDKKKDSIKVVIECLQKLLFKTEYTTMEYGDVVGQLGGSRAILNKLITELEKEKQEATERTVLHNV